MVGFLVELLIVVIIAAMAIYVIGLLPIPSPFSHVAKVIVGVIVLIWLLMALLPMTGSRRLGGLLDVVPLLV